MIIKIKKGFGLSSLPEIRWDINRQEEESEI